MSLLKRVLDLLICLVIAVPALIAILLVLPVVWLETRASPLFLQTRVGRGGGCSLS